MSTMPVRASRMFEEEGRPGDLAVTGATGIVEQGGTLQRAGSQWVTAVQVQRPRNLREVERNLMEEAALAGETMYYGWGAGKDRALSWPPRSIAAGRTTSSIKDPSRTSPTAGSSVPSSSIWSAVRR